MNQIIEILETRVNKKIKEMQECTDFDTLFEVYISFIINDISTLYSYNAITMQTMEHFSDKLKIVYDEIANKLLNNN